MEKRLDDEYSSSLSMQEDCQVWEISKNTQQIKKTM